MFDDDDDDDRERRSEVPPELRPLTAPFAVLWTLLATLLVVVLQSVTLWIRPSAAADLVNSQACVAAAYVICILLIIKVHVGDVQLGPFLGVRPTHVAFYPLAAVMGVALQIPAELVQRVIERRWPTSEESLLQHAEMLRADTTGRRIMLVIVVACVGPLVEELFCRGALHRGLRRVYGDVGVVAIVSAMFAFGHPEPRLMPPILLVAAFLGLLRAASGSIVPSLIAHMCFNGVVVVQLLAGQQAWKTESAPLPISWIVGGLAVCVLGAIAAIALARHSSKAIIARQEDCT